jgi:hypothetical protein
MVALCTPLNGPVEQEPHNGGALCAAYGPVEQEPHNGGTVYAA